MKKKQKQNMEQFEDELCLILLMHFPNYTAPAGCKDHQIFDGLRCSDCKDYKAKVCPGDNLKGEEVISCMTDKVYFGEGGTNIERSELN